MSLWGNFVHREAPAVEAPAVKLPEVEAPEIQEKAMSTSPVVSQPETSHSPLTYIKRLGSLFAHGVKKAIDLVEKDEKPIETIALTVGTIAGVGPQVQAVENTFNAMFSEVVNVEQIATAVGASTGTGQQKLAAAIPQVEQIILSDPLFKGKTITDLNKWNAAVLAITGALYDLGNAVSVPEPAAAESVAAS